MAAAGATVEGGVLTDPEEGNENPGEDTVVTDDSDVASPKAAPTGAGGVTVVSNGSDVAGPGAVAVGAGALTIEPSTDLGLA